MEVYLSGCKSHEGWRGKGQVVERSKASEALSQHMHRGTQVGLDLLGELVEMLRGRCRYSSSYGSMNSQKRDDVLLILLYFNTYCSITTQLGKMLNILEHVQ